MPSRADTALAVWRASGLPVGDCRGVDVRVLVYQDQTKLNHDCGGKAWGCTEETESGFLGTGTAYLIRLIGNNPGHTAQAILPHELGHVFSRCGLGAFDPTHSDLRVFSAPDSFEVRLAAVLQSS